MRRLTVLLSMITVSICSTVALCQNELPIPGNSASAGVLQLLTDAVLSPWVTFALVFLGMALITSELVSIGSWGLTGTAGVFCVGAVVGSSIVAGAATGIGLALLCAGLILLLVESKVLPGYAISAASGLACLFLGMLWTLGASAGFAYAVSVSALFAIMAAIAFLVHLPTNSAWHDIRRKRLEACAAKMQTGRVKITRTSATSSAPPESSESIPGHDLGHQSTKSDDDQIINRNG